MLWEAIAGFFQNILFFLSQVGRNSFLQPLTHEEEQELIEKSKKGDLLARNKLVEHNLRLVAYISRKFQSTHHDWDDLISIGTIGLIKAINTFQPENGTQLATYSARCIENEIRMALRHARKFNYELYLSDPLGEDSDGGKLEIADTIGSDKDDIENLVDQRIEIDKAHALMGELLDEREMTVIKKRYGLGGEDVCPQREIAKELNISRSYISRIQKHALNKLRNAMEGKGGKER